jgi:hypothetical protein
MCCQTERRTHQSSPRRTKCKHRVPDPKLGSGMSLDDHRTPGLTLVAASGKWQVDPQVPIGTWGVPEPTGPVLHAQLAETDCETSTVSTLKRSQMGLSCGALTDKVPRGPQMSGYSKGPGARKWL